MILQVLLWKLKGINNFVIEKDFKNLPQFIKYHKIVSQLQNLKIILVKIIVLIIYCCLKNYPKTWWLKTTCIFYPTVSVGEESGSAQLCPLQGCTHLAGWGWGHLMARQGFGLLRAHSRGCQPQVLSGRQKRQQPSASPKGSSNMAVGFLQRGREKVRRTPKREARVFLYATNRDNAIASAYLFLKSMSPRFSPLGVGRMTQGCEYRVWSSGHPEGCCPQTG